MKEEEFIAIGVDIAKGKDLSVRIETVRKNGVIHVKKIEYFDEFGNISMKKNLDYYKKCVKKAYFSRWERLKMWLKGVKL